MKSELQVIYTWSNWFTDIFSVLKTIIGINSPIVIYGVTI